MKEQPGMKRDVIVDVGDVVCKIEALAGQGSGPLQIRLSAWSKDPVQPHPVDLTEAQMVILLERAIRAGLLSPEFIHKLRGEFEI